MRNVHMDFIIEYHHNPDDSVKWVLALLDKNVA